MQKLYILFISITQYSLLSDTYMFYSREQYILLNKKLKFSSNLVWKCYCLEVLKDIQFEIGYAIKIGKKLHVPVLNTRTREEIYVFVYIPYSSKDSLHLQKLKKETREYNLRKAKSETG